MTRYTSIAEAIEVVTGAPFSATSRDVIGGGDISQAFSMGNRTCRYFVKTNLVERLPMFEAELAALEAMIATHSVRAPQPVCVGTAAGQAFLVLEYLDLCGHGNAAMLGVQLAELHRASSAPSDRKLFGWMHDNWIGGTPQPNDWRQDWIEFWRDQRLGYQLKLAAQNGYGGALQQDGDVLLSRFSVFFEGYAPTPSFLHGDLWGGNHGYLADGTPVLFDPAMYMGDRECDLAMSELFGGFAPDFYAAYRDAWPLDPGYKVRKTLYNLYHILNHANLFGGGYAAQAHHMVLRLLAEFR